MGPEVKRASEARADRPESDAADLATGEQGRAVPHWPRESRDRDGREYDLFEHVSGSGSE